MFDINKFKNRPNPHVRYLRQLERINSKGQYTKSIEIAVDNAAKNITQEEVRSFVIYGEPQSGKTEMMIALTARLLDENFKIIIVLLNDSVQLLNQNLERFRRSGIDPAPKNFNEVLDPAITIANREWIIFCKKNSKDLQRLITKLEKHKNKVIIDDEADYATPNAKVNKKEKTKINELIEELIGSDGLYIGVTATPARLDLNNTFDNQNEKWIDFPTHPLYKGQETFFPTSVNDLQQFNEFLLETLPDQGDDPKYLREAMFRFLVNVAHLNTKINVDGEKNYSILIHTSGMKADHTKDYEEVVKLFSVLSNENDKKYTAYYERIWAIAKERYPGEEDEIAEYIFENRNRHTIVVMNSQPDKNIVDYNSATNPATLFTVAIGGNIVSRGVTFDRLLSMFFTRDVKHKIQQDTYIQRARMFGTRGNYLRYFELSIPETLYLDWHKCFVFHRLSLAAIRAGKGSPVWLEDKRIAAVAGSSIDNSTVSLDSGEMSFEIFDYKPYIEDIISGPETSFERLEKLASLLGEDKVPGYLIEYMKHFSPTGPDSLALHPSGTIAGYKDADQDRIERSRSFIGNRELEEAKYPNAIHHIKILFNAKGKARLFYKFNGNIKFIKNLKKFREQ